MKTNKKKSRTINEKNQELELDGASIQRYKLVKKNFKLATSGLTFFGVGLYYGFISILLGFFMVF